MFDDNNASSSDTLCPLIDVVFLLVFALMPWVRGSPDPVQVPSVFAADSGSTSLGDSIRQPRLELDRQGQFRLNDEPLLRDTVVPRLRSLMANHSGSQSVILRCDAQLPYDAVFQARHLLHQAGIAVIEEGEVHNDRP